MKSKFKIQAYYVGILLLTLLGILGYLIWSLKHLSIVLYFLCIYLIFVSVWLFFGELRTKIIKIEIQSDRIVFRRYLGLGCRKAILFKNIEGFVTSEVHHEGKMIEYFYIISKTKKKIKISEFYHKNYLELKVNLESHLKNLGKEKFTFLKELKGIIE